VAICSSRAGREQFGEKWRDADGPAAGGGLGQAKGKLAVDLGELFDSLPGEV
jgi:hypothetical protein